MVHQKPFSPAQAHLTHLYIRPLATVLVGDGSDMFCGGKWRLGRIAVEVDAGVGYERPLVSLVTSVGTSIHGGGTKVDWDIGCCLS